MDALVLAGGIPEPDEPLYTYTQGGYKALLEVAGKPMIQWVLDALGQSMKVDRIVLSGLNSESGLSCNKPINFISNQGPMLENIRAGVKRVLELNSQAGHVLVVSSDIPGITPGIVDWVVQTAQETNDDVYYYVIPRQAMETRYPGSKRSYTRLKDVEVCGGDINVIRSLTVTQDEELWKRLIAARKNVFKQAALLGYDTLILLLLRRITMAEAVKRASQRLRISGRGVLCPYAEVGMDVDKPHQLEIMRADLEKRNPAGPAVAGSATA
jgi:GTP:adenosylcobinamide-phosphate guanylyltransferase